MSKHLQDNFKFYFTQAEQFERDGDNVQASAFYVEACRNLLELAKESDEELKRERIERVKQLKAKSEALLLPPKPLKPLVAEFKGENNEDDEGSKKFFPEEKPKVGFYNIVGLEDVKETIQENLIEPYNDPEHFKGNETIIGLTLYGPPGTGKTMIAKAIANEVDADFYAIKGSEIMSRWVGDAEKNIDDLFYTARQSKLSVIFFDEFDALGSSRKSDSVVRKSVIAALLAQTDGFEEHENKVIVIAATNLPGDIDSALSSRMPPIYVPLPDLNGRKFIVENAFKDYPVDFCITGLAMKLENWSGRNIHKLCHASRQRASTRNRKLDRNPDERIVLQEDIDICLERMPSAVTAKEIAKYEQFRDSRSATK
jgi:transitional endoplasmic reticulum ATPase